MKVTGALRKPSISRAERRRRRGRGGGGGGGMGTRPLLLLPFRHFLSGKKKLTEFAPSYYFHSFSPLLPFISPRGRILLAAFFCGAEGKWGE